MKKFIVFALIANLFIGSVFAFENPKAIVNVEIQQPVPIENENTKKDAEHEKVLFSLRDTVDNILQRVFLLFDKAEEEYKANKNKE